MVTETSLASRIASRRAVLDERFNEDIRQWRKKFGDAAVDQALREANQQRDAISAVPKDGDDHQTQLRGPRSPWTVDG